jgi:hypothetical protein
LFDDLQLKGEMPKSLVTIEKAADYLEQARGIIAKPNHQQLKQYGGKLGQTKSKQLLTKQYPRSTYLPFFFFLIY